MTKKAAKPSKRTSAPIAKIAGRVLAKYEQVQAPNEDAKQRIITNDNVMWPDVVALAASCLSQTERPKK